MIRRSKEQRAAAVQTRIPDIVALVMGLLTLAFCCVAYPAPQAWALVRNIPSQRPIGECNGEIVAENIVQSSQSGE